MKDEEKPDAEAPAAITLPEPETAAPTDPIPAPDSATEPSPAPWAKTPEPLADDRDAPPPKEPPPPITPVVTSAAPAPRPARRGGFIAALLGGALAAIGGFALSHYDILQLRPDPAATDARFAAIEQQLQEVRGTADGAATAAQSASAEASRAAQSLGDSGAGLQSLTERVDQLERLLAEASASTEGGASAAALAALSAEVQALKSRPTAAPEDTRAIVAEALQAWEADAATRADSNAEAARAAALQDAAGQALAQAVETGAPYDSALAALGVTDVPEALAKFAATGLPTLAALQDSYPDAARAGLEAALRADGSGDGVWNFLRIQTGARSLSPQTGNDPDAVLSRAEAALKTGDLDKTLAELANMPPDGQTAMADWLTAARTRSDAAKAITPLISAP